MSNLVVRKVSQLFKVEARIKILVCDEIVDATELDNWLDQLETYFTIYGYSQYRRH